MDVVGVKFISIVGYSTGGWGDYRPCNWLSLWFLMPWINHLSPVCWSICWKHTTNETTVALWFWYSGECVLCLLLCMPIYMLISSYVINTWYPIWLISTAYIIFLYNEVPLYPIFQKIVVLTFVIHLIKLIYNIFPMVIITTPRRLCFWFCIMHTSWMRLCKS